MTGSEDPIFPPWWGEALRLAGACPLSGPRVGARVLVVSSPGWNPSEQVANARALALVATELVRLGATPVIRPKNRLDKGALWSHIGVPLGDHVEWAATGTLFSWLAQESIVAVIGVESTALLEAAQAGLPVARVDLSGTTWYSRWLWEACDQPAIEAACAAVLSPPAGWLAEQDALLEHMAAPAAVPCLASSLSG